MSAPKFKVGDVVADSKGLIGEIVQATDSKFAFPYQIREQSGSIGSYREFPDMRLADTERLDGIRDSILSTAADLISGQRAKDYGDAAENFQRIADLWRPVLGVDVTREQVALCLTQLKVSRLITSPAHQDSWIDACGYLALGGEIAGTRKETP